MTATLVILLVDSPGLKIRTRAGSSLSGAGSCFFSRSTEARKAAADTTNFPE
jgi:hypothetical protein